MGVGISNALVYVILETVFGRAGRRIAKFPEILDELVARFVARQSQKSVSLVLRNKICHISLKPFLVAFFKLLFLSCCLRDWDGKEEYQNHKGSRSARYAVREARAAQTAYRAHSPLQTTA